jgi:hypothetical protein
MAGGMGSGASPSPSQLPQPGIPAAPGGGPARRAGVVAAFLGVLVIGGHGRAARIGAGLKFGLGTF